MSSKLSPVRGQVALVTGAASGLGRAFSELLVENGAQVHLVDVQEGPLADLVEQLRRTGAAWAHKVDVTDRDEMLELADQVFGQHGRLDILVNNAGVFRGGPFLQIPREDWERVFAVNFWGLFNGIEAFLPRMLEQDGGGRIVNMASAAGLIGIPYVGPYGASKFAVVGLSEGLAAELSGGPVSLTTACPGAVRTPLLKNSLSGLPGDWGDKLSDLLSRKGADPRHVASTILSAALDGKRFVVPAAGGLLPMWLTRRLSLPLYGKVTDLLAWLGRDRSQDG